MWQISIVRVGPKRNGMIEQEHLVTKLMKWLPAGPTDDGGHREKDLVQFVARNGGIRTVPADDLTVL